MRGWSSQDQGRLPIPRKRIARTLRRVPTWAGLNTRHVVPGNPAAVPLLSEAMTTGSYTSKHALEFDTT